MRVVQGVVPGRAPYYCENLAQRILRMFSHLLRLLVLRVLDYYFEYHDNHCDDNKNPHTLTELHATPAPLRSGLPLVGH